MFGSLTLTALSGAPTIRADHDLVAVIAAAIEHSDVEFPGNDVLILMQKIV
jgi:F420-0:gamma-glutamyl ligase